MFDEFGINAGYVEDLHTRWLQSPQSVEADWQRFFEGNRGAPEIAPPRAPHVVAKTNGAANGNGLADLREAVPRDPRGVAYREAVRETVIAAAELQSRVAQLVNAYRVRGHLFAHLDPLDYEM